MNSVNDMSSNMNMLSEIVKEMKKDQEVMKLQLSKNSDAINSIQKDITVTQNNNQSRVDDFTIDEESILAETNSKKRKAEYSQTNSNCERNTNKFGSHKVGYTKTQFKKTIITGKNPRVHIQTSEKLFHAYLGNVSLDEKESNLINHCKSLNLEIKEFKQLNNYHTKHKFKSFMITIPFDQKEIIFDPENWQRGMILSQYKKPKSMMNNLMAINNNNKDLMDTNGFKAFSRMINNNVLNNINSQPNANLVKLNHPSCNTKTVMSKQQSTPINNNLLSSDINIDSL